MIHMRFYFRFLIFACGLLFSFSVMGLEEVVYSLPVEDSPLLIKKQVEKVDNTISVFDDQGFLSPDKALVTFFHLARQDSKKEIIDMHYLPDGSRGFIRGMLANDPEAFLGSRSLSSINIKDIVYWGDKKIVNFSMTDTNGGSADWQEKFICSNARCYKSNTSFFKALNSKEQYYDALDSYKNVFVGSASKADDQYESYSIYPGDQPKYPLQVLIKRGDLDSGILSKYDWYAKLSGLNQLITDASYDVDKIEKIGRYLEKIYVDWDQYKFVYSDFTGVGREKDYYQLSLFGLRGLELVNYLKYKGYVWIFLNALASQSAEGSSSLLLVYSEEKNKFVNDEFKESVEFSAVDTVLRNKLISDFVLSSSVKKDGFELGVGILSDADGQSGSKLSGGKESESKVLFFSILSVIAVFVLIIFAVCFKFLLKMFGFFKEKK